MKIISFHTSNNYFIYNGTLYIQKLGKREIQSDGGGRGVVIHSYKNVPLNLGEKKNNSLVLTSL